MLPFGDTLPSFQFPACLWQPEMNYRESSFTQWEETHGLVLRWAPDKKSQLLADPEHRAEAGTWTSQKQDKLTLRCDIILHHTQITAAQNLWLA